MNHSDLKRIADRFRKLPFAFLQEPEIDALADDIASARKTADLIDAVAKLSMDIETHRACDNWGKAEHEEEVLNDLQDWDGILSLEEKTKLRELVRSRAKDFSKILSSSIKLKMPAWDLFLKERGIRRIDQPCMLEEGEVGVNDPFGSHLAMTEETARKILVLGF
jgi:hypothetical protein